MLSDLRFAFRLLLKSRGFAAVTLLTLGLCIGANTAIFSAVYTLMLKPLPFPEPARIVEIYNSYPKANIRKLKSNVVEYLDYKMHAESYSDFGLWRSGPALFGEDAVAEPSWGGQATADLFSVLGVKPLIGRFFSFENSRPNEGNVVVLTQSFWAARFGEDPAVIGKTTRIDRETVTIVGVAPRSFESFDARVRFVRPYVWEPAQADTRHRHAQSVQLFARLKAGVTVARAQAEGDNLEHRYNQTSPADLKQFVERTGARIQIGLVQAERVQPLKSSLLMLQGGVIFVLLIGCVNIANLLLARANGRRSELAVRIALGATRGEIIRQLLLETLLLTTLGTALGLGIGWSAIAALNRYRAELMPETLPFALDGGVLGVTIAVSVIASLLIGIAPIVHILRTNLMQLVHSSSRGASGSSGVRALGRVLIIGQVALALMLLTGAGLLIQSFAKAIAVDPGFDPKGVITARVAVPPAHRASEAAAHSLQDRIAEGMKEIPSVSAVAVASVVPFEGMPPPTAFILAEDFLPPGSPQPGAHTIAASPSYLETLRLRLIEGRFLELGDTQPGRTVYVVDETFAKTFFPGRSAVGQRMVPGAKGKPDKESDWATIVGVVRNVPHNGVEERAGSQPYFVYRVLNASAASFSLFLRTTRPTTDTIALMREKLRAIDPGISLLETGSLQQSIDGSFNQRRAVMLLLGTFAALALFLSGLGIYGVLAYDVSQRTREIGVRGAIGATRSQIIWLIMRQGLSKTALGLVIGLVAAIDLSSVMKSLLFDISPTDPSAYIAVSLILLLVAAAASYFPARSAAKINPIEALRAQ